MSGGIDPLFENHPEVLKAKADRAEAWESLTKRADKSEELREKRRKFRDRILRHNDDELRHLYYEVMTLSEHEAARLEAERILGRSSLSNRAEA